MAAKVREQTTYEAARTIQPIYGAGDVATNRDGSLIATSIDEDIAVIDVQSGKPLCRIDGDGEPITSLCLTPDASYLIICSRSRSMRIFRLHINKDGVSASCDLQRTLKPHTSPVISSSVESTGSLLATGGADGTVKVWDIRGGFATHNFHPHGGIVSALLFFKTKSYDETRINQSKTTSPLMLASAGEDGKVKVHDLMSRKLVATLESHVSLVRTLSFSESKQIILSASRDRTMTLWDIKKWKAQVIIPALEVLEFAGFILDGQFCYSAGENGIVRVWSTTTGQEVTSKQKTGLETDSIVSCVDCTTISALITLHRDQTFRFHSYVKLKELPPDTVIESLPIVRRISANLDEVIDMACVGPNQSLLALATNTESVKIVSIQETSSSDTNFSDSFGNDVKSLEGHKDIIICLDVDWSGNWLATGAKDNTARLWRIDPASSSYRCVAVCEGHAGSLGAIALPRAPPSSGLAASHPLDHPPAFMLTGSLDKTVKRWDTSKLNITSEVEPQSNTRALYTRVAHDKDINALDVSPTLPIFASASQDKTIKVFSLEDGSTAGILRGHKRGVWSTAFSPAGAAPINLTEGGSSSSRGFLASGSGDRSVKIWSLSSYTCLLTLEGHSNSVLKVIWLQPPSSTSDGVNGSSSRSKSNQPLLASASADTLIKIWSPYSTPDSDHLLTTLDNHTDRVWALTTPYSSSNSHPSSSYSLISGAADATITFWRDTTVQTATIATQRATERIEQDQQLQNHIHNKDYREVITLSLALNHPGRLLRVFQDITSLPKQDREPGSMMGVKAVDDVLASLDAHQVYQMLERVRDWNTNARTAPVAQKVLGCLLRSYPKEFFVEMGRERDRRGWKELLRALEVYTERHYKRMEELGDESWLLEFTLREMDEVAGTGLGEVAMTNGHPVMT